MAQTHLSLHVHLIFHTLDNRKSIKEEWRNNLHAFLGGCLKTAGCVPEAVGGTHDHVHILAGFRATHCIADVVKDIKVASSKWVHNEIGHRMFAWQGGYGAITVSPSQILESRITSQIKWSITMLSRRKMNMLRCLMRRGSSMMRNICGNDASHLRCEMVGWRRTPTLCIGLISIAPTEQCCI
ncbi:MAG: transposase [Pyrinomonadaceae bacterium]|nr:transposase [Pyrinomonadaceae bacterium]